MVIVVSAIVFVLDFTFENLNSHGVERLKAIVQQDESNTIDNTVQDNNETDNTTVENNVSNETTNTVENNETNSNEVQE